MRNVLVSDVTPKCGRSFARTRHWDQPWNSSVLIEQIWSDVCRSSLPSNLQSATISIGSATSTHETISSSIEALLLLSGANYWAHRFRLRQQSDASSHSSDSILAQFRIAWRYMPNGRLSRIINTKDALTAATISEAFAPAKANVAT